MFELTGELLQTGGSVLFDSKASAETVLYACRSRHRSDFKLRWEK